jgi:Lrp/AsnC family transcriptional regulator, leucine-responsive regulatory protein
MIDDIDITILDILQQRGRTKRNDLAEAVGLSLPAVSDRLRKLEEQHIITGYHATVDPKKLGKDIAAFILVSIDSSKHYGQFIDHVDSLHDVLECHAITGEGTHLLKVRTTDTASLERLLAKIQAWSGVVSTKTTLVLSTPKESTRIKLDQKK